MRQHGLHRVEHEVDLRTEQIAGKNIFGFAYAKLLHHVELTGVA